MIYGKEIKKVHGPYTSKEDGRQRVIIVFIDNKKKTVSYPKYLMEQKLGRELDPNNETIDHIDGNFLNNDWSNLRIIERSKHCSDDAERVDRHIEIELECIWCRIKFKPKTQNKARYREDNKNRGKTGPFCSKKCTGEYGANLQHGNISKLENELEVNKTYYKIKK